MTPVLYPAFLFVPREVTKSLLKLAVSINQLTLSLPLHAQLMVLWELSENYQSSDNSQIFLNIGTKACTPRFGAGGWVFTLFCRKEGTQRLTGGNKAADSFSGPLVFRAWPYLTRLCQQHIILNGFSPCPLALRLQKVGVGFCPQNVFGCRSRQAPAGWLPIKPCQLPRIG